MSFRTVIIKRSSKLQYIQGYINIYDGDKETKVYLNDISLLIIESTSTLLTSPLLIEAVKNNISVILCDEKHNPYATVLGLNKNYHSSDNIFKQIKWKDILKKKLWKEVIERKIAMQMSTLTLLKKRNEHLEKYIAEVQLNDKTNREGLAAKTYFTTLFTKEFTREENNVINGYLDYGYAIILSCFNRELVGAGYLTQLGIKHIGKTNPFNLSSDLMEPFRPLVDIIVSLSVYDKEPKKRIRKLLTHQVLVDDSKRYVDDAIRVFVMECIRYMNGLVKEIPLIQLIEMENYKGVKSDEINNNV